MESNGHSAERELLKAIEGSGGQKEKKAKTAAYLNSGELKSRIHFLSHNLKTKLERRFITPYGTVDLTAVQKSLKAAVIVLFCLYLASAARGAYLMNQIPVFDFSPAATSETESSGLGSLLLDFAHYGNVLLQDNIFTPKEKVEPQEKEAPVVRPVLHQMIDNLKISGISRDEETGERFAIAEDRERKITYFLQEGDKILDFTVKNIFDNRVVFLYQDQEITLR